MLEVSVPIAYELLAQCIKQGQALVQRASLVGDFSDYEAWKTARKQWIDPTAHALEHMYDGSREAHEFADAVSCADAGANRWQQQYAADLDCVKRALELLTVLQSDLAFEPPAEPEVPAPPSAQEPMPTLELEPTPAPEPEPQAALPPEREREPAERLHAAAPEGEREPTADRDREVGAELARTPLVGSELAHAQPEAVAPGENAAPAPERARARRVFVAHGRDERWKEAVAHLLAQAGSDEVTILNDHPEQRAELLHHIGERAGASRYAIVLLTADDIGAARLESAEEPYFTTRAGQSVVFEMGFLLGALTPARVCILYEDGVELPFELTGISHMRLDLAGSWQPKLLLTLRRAGFDYDLNRLAAA